MTDGMIRSPNAQSAFNYLRTEALDAHLAGDGMKVLHACVTALEAAGTPASARDRRFDFADVRWALFLGCYWMVDDWICHLIEEVLKAAGTDAEPTWDQKLLTFLLFTLRIPVNFASTEELVRAPPSWLAARSHAVEDVAALTLAIEIAWYENCRTPAWRELGNAWLAASPTQSRLAQELRRAIHRLSLQSSLYGSGIQIDGSLPQDIATEQRALIVAWKAFQEARFEDLDTLLQDLAKKVRVESPVYPALFRLIHFSRVHRESRESQFLSMSRLQFIESRQPSQACQQLRDERFESNYSRIARKGFSDSAAGERHTCFRMALSNQLHALRTWDVGGWLQGERQRAYALVELSAGGDLRFLKQSILSLRNALSVPSRAGDFPQFERTLVLLDALQEEERQTLVEELLNSPRIAWSGAHRVLDQLSDAIPLACISDVAEWYVRLDLDAYYAKWKRTYLEMWGNLIHMSEDRPRIIECLMPALIAKACDWRCWDDLHGTLCAAIISGDLVPAKQLLDLLLHAPCDDRHSDAYRFSIALTVSRNRPELGVSIREWLLRFLEKWPSEYNSFQVRHLDATHDGPKDDREFRDWVRRSVIETCDKMLTEREGSITFGLAQYHPHMLEVTWPDAESAMMKRLIEVIDAEYVPFANKGDPLACLGVLASRCPRTDVQPIIDAAIRWLNDGILGKDLGHSSPLSTYRILGLGPLAIASARGFLAEVLAKEHFDSAGGAVSKWILVEGVRLPSSVAQHTLATALHCSVGMNESDAALSVALLGIAEAIATKTFMSQPRETILGFAQAILQESPSQAVTGWLESTAGKLCLEMWGRRLVEASGLASTSAREAAAMAIRQWEDSGLRLPESLENVQQRLTADCRLRVRAALKSQHK